MLEKVLAAYPPERTKKLKHRAESVWYGPPSADRIAYVFMDNGCRNAPEIPADATEQQAALVSQLQSILNHSEWDDDFYPALFPGLRQVAIPSYFGCVEEFASNSVRVRPIIKNAGDVYNAHEPGFARGSAGYETLELMKYFRERTRGLLPLYIADVQGPFSVASQAWGVENFLLALHENPDEVEYFLQRCLNAVTTFFRLMFEAADGDLIPIHCMPALWYPKEKGVAVSEDLMAVVSPETIDRFICPNLERVADEFGGVLVHSCGGINHAVGVLNSVRGLTGINCASTETNIESLASAMDPKLKLVAHNSPVCCGGLPLYDQLEHIELCKKIFMAGRVDGFCLVFPWNIEPLPETHADAYRRAAMF